MSASLETISLGARNNAWANQTFYAALAGMDEATFTAPRPGFFPSLSRTLNHIYEVDLYYFDVLENGGAGLNVFAREDITRPDDLSGLQKAVDIRLIRFCDRLAEDGLSETRVTKRMDGPVEETVRDLLLHLFQHQIHHRGQAHVQLSDAGVAPPQLDDFYLSYGRTPSAAALRGA